jgi:hypothetical protein
MMNGVKPRMPTLLGRDEAVFSALIRRATGHFGDQWSQKA